MTTIIYGKTVRPITHAAGRRTARRKTEAIRRELLESCIDKALGLKPESRSRKELKVLSKPKIKHLTEHKKYTEKLDYFTKKYERENRRIWYSKPKTEYGITARSRPTSK